MNTKIHEALQAESAIPISTISASWLGISDSDITFTDSPEEWIKRLRNILLDANLEMRGSEWWIRSSVEDGEILDVVNVHTSHGKIDIPAVMEAFQNHGWTIAGVTTGKNVFRKYYEEQTGFKVRKDGTIVRTTE